MSNESSYLWIVTRPQVQFLGLGTLAAIAAFGCYTAVQAGGHNHYLTFFIDLKKSLATRLTKPHPL